MADYFAEFDSKTSKDDYILASFDDKEIAQICLNCRRKKCLMETSYSCYINSKQVNEIKQRRNNMNKYRINYRLTRENGTRGFKSTTIYADDILDALTQLYELALDQNIEIKIYSIFYLAEGIESIV